MFLFVCSFVVDFSKECWPLLLLLLLFLKNIYIFSLGSGLLGFFGPIKYEIQIYINILTKRGRGGGGAGGDTHTHIECVYQLKV